MMFKVESGLRIAASVWGNDEDPLVILLPGGGQTRHAWKRAGEKLGQAGFWTVALDTRGHGDSDWHPDGDYSLVSLVDDVKTIINQLGKPAAIVGASMGGILGISIAGDQTTKSLCWALVMVDIGIYPNASGAQEIVDFMRSGSKGYASLDDAAKAVSEYLPHRKKPSDTSGLEKNLRKRKDGRYYWHWDPAFLDTRDDEINERYKRKRRVFAENVSAPTLLVQGAMSNVLTDDEVEDFLATVAHAEFAKIDNAAHMVAGDRNDIFASCAIEFLRMRKPQHHQKIGF
jgi:pimeloyl-ACP methyl ester carboxylesterase